MGRKHRVSSETHLGPPSSRQQQQQQQKRILSTLIAPAGRNSRNLPAKRANPHRELSSSSDRVADQLTTVRHAENSPAADTDSASAPSPADSSLHRDVSSRKESRREIHWTGDEDIFKIPKRTSSMKTSPKPVAEMKNVAESKTVLEASPEAAKPVRAMEPEQTNNHGNGTSGAKVAGTGQGSKAHASALESSCEFRQLDYAEALKQAIENDSSDESKLATENGDEEKRRHMRGQEEQQDVFEAGGIRFAPWNIPFQRRLQTMAVALHSLSIAICVSAFFALCAIPFAWPALIPYLVHMLVSTAAADGKLRFRSEKLRHWPGWRFFADYFPARLHKTQDLPPTRKYIFGYHPHGIISHGAFAAFATEACGFGDKFPGITNSLLTLESNFRIPIYRDYVLAMGLRSVSKESIGHILTRGGPNGEGMGRAVTIVVGGARESLEAEPGTLRLILRERKGFVKLAVRTGADLVPVLAFGENDLYDQISPKLHPALHKLQMFALRTLKFTLPFLHGRGIFNYDVGLMPYRRPLNIVVGRPVKVAQPPASASLDNRELDRLHYLYLTELQRIWDTYKNEFARDRKGELVFLK